jgi:2-dehydro-3-deoxyphosphooctonate aldolase (KDO 8-P synthase)
MKLCGFEAGLDQPFFLIAGPCTAESEQLCLDVAGHMKEVCARLGIPYIFKASYDKANRSSGKSVRGLGLDEGLRIFSEVQRQIGVPVLTDVHTVEDIPAVAADAGLPQPADRFHPCCRDLRQAGQYQEGPVPGAG